MTTRSPTSVAAGSIDDSAATTPKKGSSRSESMTKRLVGGRFSPSRKTSEKLDDLDEPQEIEIFKNDEDEEAQDDSDNIDLSVVRSVLGSSFKFDKGLDNDKEVSGGRAVSFSGVDSPASSKADDIKSNGELLAKIGRLELKLKQAELDYSAEKARRKKSSRSTIKLAKEINKRTVEAAAQQKAIEKVRENLTDQAV
jgi:hypothetical protein